MSKPSTQLRFADVYPSFREGSRANPLVQQESGPGHPTIDISGRKCLESFERLAPPMSWQRTFVASLVGMKGWFSTRCALTWKVKATKSARSFFQLQASTRRTAETASGLLLTPREEPVDLVKFKARMEKYPNGTTMPNRATQVQQMLPTPTRFDYNSARTPQKWKEDKAKYAAKGINLQNPLKQHARLGMLPTPTASSWYNGIIKERPQGQPSRRSQLNHLMAQEAGKTSQLSPLFVEEMMGFPPGWTASPFQSGDESP